MHFLTAMRALNGNRINKGAVELNIVRTIVGHGFQFLNTADRVHMTAFACPDIKGCTPISITGNTPILNIFKPVTETSLADIFGNPVNGIIVTDKVILNIGHFYKP